MEQQKSFVITNMSLARLIALSCTLASYDRQVAENGKVIITIGVKQKQAIIMATECTGKKYKSKEFGKASADVKAYYQGLGQTL